MESFSLVRADTSLFSPLLPPIQKRVDSNRKLCENKCQMYLSQCFLWEKPTWGQVDDCMTWKNLVPSGYIDHGKPCDWSKAGGGSDFLSELGSQCSTEQPIPSIFYWFLKIRIYWFGEKRKDRDRLKKSICCLTKIRDWIHKLGIGPTTSWWLGMEPAKFWCIGQ